MTHNRQVPIQISTCAIKQSFRWINFKYQIHHEYQKSNGIQLVLLEQNENFNNSY